MNKDLEELLKENESKKDIMSVELSKAQSENPDYDFKDLISAIQQYDQSNINVIIYQKNENKTLYDKNDQLKSYINSPMRKEAPKYHKR